MNCSIKITLLLSAVTLIACTGNKQQAPDTRTLLDKYVDSMMVAYPNYSGNIVVAKRICEDFKTRIDTLPGILEGAPFSVVGIHELFNGEVTIMISADAGSEAGTGSEAEKNGKFGSLIIWCENFDKELASQIREDGMYKVTGGKLDHYKPAHGIADKWLKLGDLYVNDLTLEPIENTK